MKKFFLLSFALFGIFLLSACTLSKKNLQEPGENTQEKLENQALIRCRESEYQITVFVCQESLKVTNSQIPREIVFSKIDGTQIICPPPDSNNISQECQDLLAQTCQETCQSPLKIEETIPDPVQKLLSSLHLETQINFSDLERSRFKWKITEQSAGNSSSLPVPVLSKAFQASTPSQAQLDSVDLFLKNNSFQPNPLNSSTDILSSIDAYLSSLPNGDYLACQVIKKFSENQNLVEKLTIDCGTYKKEDCALWTDQP